MRLNFKIPAVPVPQPRQRHRVVHANGKAFSANYTPTRDPVNAFKAACQVRCGEVFDGPPLTGPLEVIFIFVLPRGAKPAWLKKSSVWWSAWKAGERIPHALARPDRDNLMKSLQDALNGLLWKDDGLLAVGPVEKWVAAADESPHVEIHVATFEPAYLREST